MNIVLIGPQGSGKTTQAKHVASRFKMHHVPIGELIRQEAAKDTPKGKLFDHISNHKGRLIPDGIVLDLLLEHLQKQGYDNNVFDGFPRTINQYHALLDFLATKKQTLDLCVYLKISDADTVHRAQERGRLDDNPQVIAARIDEYHRVIDPLLAEMETDGRLLTIEGNLTSAEISSKLTQEILERQQPTSESSSQPVETRKIFVVAHCQSDYNQLGIYTGRIDIDLSQEGHQRCELSAEILKQESIQVAYRSSLIRTKQTLDHIMKYHPDIQVVVDDRLIERSNGELDGMSKEEYKKTRNSDLPDFDTAYDIAPPGGETMEQVEERVMNLMNEVIARIKSEKINILIVSHDNAIRPIRRHFENLTKEQAMRLSHQRHQIFTYEVQVD